MLRGTVAIFWGSLNKDQVFYRQMKENRRIEDLILTFVSTAHNSLKKNKQLEGDAWKIELNNQIAQFIRILQECLRVRDVGHVSPELIAKVDGYAQRLVPTSEQQHHEHGPNSSHVANGAGPSSGAIMFSSVSEMPLVQAVSRLFGHTDQEVQGDLASLRKTCTPKVRRTTTEEA